MEKKIELNPKLKGKYIKAVGKRKNAVALIHLFKSGDGEILINGKKSIEYFKDDYTRSIILQPLKLTGLASSINLSIKIKGGGKIGQADAVRHGIARALIIFNKELRPALKAKGFLTRDARIKERKKPGLKKARRAPQWSKR